YHRRIYDGKVKIQAYSTEVDIVGKVVELRNSLAMVVIL
ncbi:hypothetical protein A2U01_0067693, partial [Trifolium medium]|nr:hypothetical protein [Trifolium medium]